MGLFGNFHDSCVREVHVVTGHFVEEDLTMRVDWRTTIHMLIQRQFRNPCAIELRFEEVVGLRMVPPQPECYQGTDAWCDVIFSLSLEIALVLVRFDHVASFILNLKHSVM